MVDNLRIFDGSLNSITLRTTEDSGEHIPHHKIRLIDSRGSEYRESKRLPVAVQAVSGGSIIFPSSPVFSPLSEDNGVTIWGRESPGGGGYRTIISDSGGSLQVAITEFSASQIVGSAPLSPQSGVVAAGVQVGTAASQVSANDRYAPLTFDSDGKLFVTFGPGGGGSPITAEAFPSARSYMRLL